MSISKTGGNSETPTAGITAPWKADAEFEEKSSSPSMWSRPPWSWLISIRVGIVLLAILTVASIVGTVIDPLERAQRLVFYTWWYKGLLVVLSVNMVFATLRTIGRRLLAPLKTWIRRSPQYFDTANPGASVPYDGDAVKVAEALRRHGYAAVAEGDFGYGIKGRLGRWGAPISHVGLIAILLSGFAASWVAKEGYIQQYEGRSVSTMRMRGEDDKEVPLGYEIRIDDFETGFFPRTRIPSHYISTITATKGDRVLYHGKVEVNHSPVIEGWAFHQTSFELADGPRYRVRIESKDLGAPVEMELSPGQVRPVPGMKGVTAGLMGGASPSWKVFKDGAMVAQGSATGSGSGATTSYRYRVSVEEAESGTAVGTYTLDLNKAVSLGKGDDGAETTLIADQFQPDFVIGPERTITSRSNQLNNPALHVAIRQGEKEIASQWLFGRDDMKGMMHAAAGKYKLELVEVEEAKANPTDAAAEPTAAPEWNVTILEKVPLYITLLSTSRNPLIPVIYGACGLMMLGLMIGFFTPRKEVWFRVNAKKNLLQVAAAYRYSREELDGSLRAVVKELTGGCVPRSGGENPGAARE